MTDWQMIEQCWLSGQMTAAEMHEHMNDADFKHWITDRAEKRASSNYGL